MQYIQGTSREQIFLFQKNLDNIIEENNPVRFIDAYVESLDLEKLGFIVPKAEFGRPPFMAKLLLKMYIYCYLNKIRSSRKIEKECNRNKELIWLTEDLSPDFKTIADFRRDNKKGLKNIFKEFLKLCHQLNLLEFKLVGTDGTKMRAKNGMNSIYKRGTIEKIEKKIEEKINEYISELEANDEREKNEYEFLSQNIGEKIKRLKKRKEKVNIIKEIFKENPELETYFAGDPDSSFQKDKGRTRPGYNCQIGVDEKHKLIVSNDVTNEGNDTYQLKNMKEKICKTKQENKIKGKTTIVADSGYYNAKEILEVEKDKNVDTYVCHPRDAKTKKISGREVKDKIPANGFEKDDFKYDEEKAEYECPMGKRLIKQRGNGRKRNGIIKFSYKCKDCNNCECKNLCTTSKNGRTVESSIEEEEYRKKINTEFGKKIIKKRKEIVEHPFGTIKNGMDYRCFMQKGIENVRSEFGFITFIYNLKRILNIISLKELIAAVK